ncbi:hypothetical protein PC9H_001960 [Pleurotus ostreatus]|uniref:Poly(A) RNA polymerase mitochondrial-like central palm domain-containing protein n=1 Tax=Pleurotus ostreatus TaxID=5322 RepID=A0A8H6ZHQ1_PLEOS|nr:uncharacterized protein PC9H_001960 [Pleurotus ostreatus]KAF7419373.1 hypothetical protein PC9H_001960 [Pleurotus ostreatus]
MQQQQAPPNPFLRALNEAAERRRQDASNNNRNKSYPLFPPLPSASGSGMESETQQVNVNNNVGPFPSRGRGRGREGFGEAPRGGHQHWRNNPSAAGQPSHQPQGRPYRQPPNPSPVSIPSPSTPHSTYQPDVPRAVSPVSRAMEHARSVLQRRPPPPHIQRLPQQQQPQQTRPPPQRTKRPQGAEELRRETLRRINGFVNWKFGNEFRVELFGSGHYGVASPSSDLDLVIVDRNRMTGFRPSESRGDWLPSIYNIRRLGKDLWDAGYKNVLAIPSANVPIVKFLDPVTGMECDINVNDQLGLINSRMLKIYCDMSPVLRPMLFAVKAWAKPLGLNNPSGKMGPRTFSSYALALMTIGFLQMRGLLPNLQADLEPLDPKCEDEGSIFWVRQKQKRIKCDIRYDSRSAVPVPVQNDIELLMKDWYWGREFDYAEMMVVIREGGIVRRPVPMQEPEKKKKKKGKGKASAEEVQQFEQEQGQNHEGQGAALATEVEGAHAEEPKTEEVEEVEEAEDDEVIDITDAGDAFELDSNAPGGSSTAASQSTQGVLQPQTQNDGAAAASATAEGNVVTQLPAYEDQWKWHQLVVVDPFIRNKNVVQGTKQRVPIFIEACRDAVRELDAGKTVNEMVAGLVPVAFPSAPPRKRKFKNKAKGKGKGDPTAQKVETR